MGGMARRTRAQWHGPSPAPSSTPSPLSPPSDMDTLRQRPRSELNCSVTNVAHNCSTTVHATRKQPYNAMPLEVSGSMGETISEYLSSIVIEMSHLYFHSYHFPQPSFSTGRQNCNNILCHSRDPFDSSLLVEHRRCHGKRLQVYSIHLIWYWGETKSWQMLTRGPASCWQLMCEHCSLNSPLLCAMTESMSTEQVHLLEDLLLRLCEEVKEEEEANAQQTKRVSWFIM